MMFILNMARRELRSAWKRLLFFFLCIAIGVGAIVALRSIIRNFHDVMASDARKILGADIRISSGRPWTPEALATIDRVTKPYSPETAEAIESDTMMRPVEETNERALLVELEGIEPPFPFYGTYTLANNEPFDHRLLMNNGLIVARSVLERLELKLGDPVKIGTQVFTLRAILEREPGLSGGFQFGPKVLINKSALENAGLTGFGSRTRRRIMIRVANQDVDKITKELRSALKSNFINVRSYKQSQERIDNQFTRAENFLSLAGFIILILGGIGVSSVTRVFIEEKRKSIAVLKCIGATGHHGQPGLLDHLVGGGRGGHERAGQAAQRPVVAVEEPAERHLVALAQRRDQRSVVGEAVGGRLVHGRHHRSCNARSLGGTVPA
jgi:putative ABC transport system permease protein